MKTFSEQLLAARKASGKTQEQLADQLNVSRPMISHWETGRSLPDLETIKRLSQALSYNFLQEEDPDFADQLEVPDAPEDNSPRKKRGHTALLGFLVGVVVTIAVALFVFLPKFPGDLPAYKPFVESGGASPEWFKQPNERVEGQAYLDIFSPENPLKVTLSDDGEEEAMWMYDIRLEEQNGIDFTIERHVLAMFYSDTMVLLDSADAQAITSMWGFNTILGGESFWIFGEIPRRSMKSIGFMFVGVDANGNELVFRYHLELSQALKEANTSTEESERAASEAAVREMLATYKQPNERIEGQAYVDISTGENPLRAVRSGAFTSGLGWRYTFAFEEMNGINFTVEKATLAYFISETKAYQYTYNALELSQWWNHNVIAGHGEYLWPGERAFQDMYGIGIMVEGEDANGNQRAFHYFLELSQEIAE